MRAIPLHVLKVGACSTQSRSYMLSKAVKPHQKYKSPNQSHLSRQMSLSRSNNENLKKAATFLNLQLEVKNSCKDN